MNTDIGHFLNDLILERRRAQGPVGADEKSPNSTETRAVDHGDHRMTVGQNVDSRPLVIHVSREAIATNTKSVILPLRHHECDHLRTEAVDAW